MFGSDIKVLAVFERTFNMASILDEIGKLDINDSFVAVFVIVYMREGLWPKLVKLRC